MRISDWSSDVCSSDLGGAAEDPGRSAPEPQQRGGGEARRRAPEGPHQRSEEHTSELQSLMRISYAVFCLKKKKQLNKVIYDNKLSTMLTNNNRSQLSSTRSQTTTE